MPASTITVTPSETVFLGEPFQITISSESPAYTHTVSYVFGGASGTLYTNLRADKLIGGAWAAVKEFSPPAEWTAQVASGTISLQGTLTCETFDGSTKIGQTSAVFTVALPPSTFTVSGDLQIGAGNTRISISRASPALTHQIVFDAYSIPKTPSSVPVYSGIYPAAPDGAAVIDWTPPPDILTDLSGTVALTDVTLKTFNGSALVGTFQRSILLSFVSTPATRPFLSFVSWEAVNPTMPSPLSFQYIAGISKLRISAEYEAPYSSITRSWCELDGVEVIGSIPEYTNVETGVLQTSGAVTASVSVQNARGETDTLSNTLTVYPYSAPRLIAPTGESGVVCVRALADGTPDPGGTAMLIKCGRVISSVGGNNRGYATYTIDGGAETTFSASSTQETISDISVTVPNAFPDRESTYTVQLHVYDDVSTGAGAYGFRIPKTAVTMHLREGGLGVGVGQYANFDRRVEISPSWDVTGRVFGLGNLPVITSGEDLNSYRTPGRYAVTTNAIASSLSNCPASAGGVLTVYASSGALAADPEAATWQYLIQEYRTYAGEATFQRYLMVGGTAGSWTYYPWYRTYPQPNALSVPLTYTSNPLITSANFTAGFTLHKTGPLCILSINAQPTSSTAATLTAIGNVPAGSRPKIEIVQTSIQQDTAFAPVAVDIGAASGNIFLYKPNASTAMIRMIVPYFTDI